MSASGMGEVLQHLRRAALLHDQRTLTDEQLLERFFTRRDESAFETLVGRHGPMVFGVCRRLAGNLHDAELIDLAIDVVAEKSATTKSAELLRQFHALFKEGKYREAEMVALKACELDPNNPKARSAVQLAVARHTSPPVARTPDQILDFMLERLEKLEKRLNALDGKRR